MSKIAAVVSQQAALLGGQPLKPKHQDGKTSVAATFQQPDAAERFKAWLASKGWPANARRTYNAVLVTTVV